MEEFLMWDQIIIWSIAIVLFLAVGIPFLLKKRRMEAETEAGIERAERYGLNEPVSLHPVVNPDICIGSSGCIDACPEQDVLGLRNGQAIAVSPAHCVGHGLCERSCPVEAIQLVFGSETRGVEIPRIQENFETNVDGIFIIGELGGMGLIRNAFEQARQCLEGIVREQRTRTEDALDAIIVGCGPAGLAATIYAKNAGLQFATVEREDIGGTVCTYPRKKVVMTEPLIVPEYGKIHKYEIQKEELMDLWEDIVAQLDLDKHIHTGVTVKDIQRRSDKLFEVTTNDKTYTTARVILAIGRRGTPRKLGIPGEELPNVSYALREPEQFEGNTITVVGGGDSAVEAALALSDQPGTTVRISYRKGVFSRIKAGNRERIEAALDQQRLSVLWNTNVIENHEDHILIEHKDGSINTYSNEYLFVFAGGILPTPFLKKVGVKIDVKFGEPRYSNR
jgi:thioredoxin reductase/Pyruvate/2-oxoacid:ferredoxin oxidoreductase delta subunit